MQRAFSQLGLIVALLAFTGCSGDQDEPQAKAEDKEEKEKPATGIEKHPPLLAEIAKEALLEMDKGQIPAGILVPPPEARPIEMISAHEMTMGFWKCDLKEKTFSASTFFPDAPRHKVNQVSGVFQRLPGGKWVAKVTRSSSAH